jgi:hypothetical protein
LKDIASRRPTSKPLPSDADRLSRDELRRLAKAERKAASADLAVAASGRREIAELERRRQIRLEGAGLAVRVAETLALARGRGEEVRAESLRIAAPALDDHGAPIVDQGLPVYRRETISRMRIASRGGLQLAFERGDLDGGPLKAERLFDVAKTYRWAFETASALRSTARDLSTVSARAPLRASAGPQDAVFAAGEILRALRGGFSERQREAADRVCGLDMTVRAAALALKADPRTVRRALVEALTLAAEAQRKPAAA